MSKEVKNIWDKLAQEHNCYTNEARRGFIAGFDAAMERVKPLVEVLEEFSRFAHTHEALVSQFTLKKFRGEE